MKCPAARNSAALTAGLILAAAALITTSFFSLRTPGSRTNLDAAQLQVDTLVRARALYALRNGRLPASAREVERRRAPLIRDLTHLTEASPTPRAIRRLAIVQYTFGDPGWKASLLRLRTLPRSGATFQTEEELAFWSDLFDGTVRQDQVAAIAGRIATYNLGWYEHLAMETAYRRAGLDERARAQQTLANSSTTRLFGLLNLAVLAGICGMAFGLRQAVRLVQRRRQSRRSAYEFVSSQQEPAFTPPPRPQADVMYSAFVVYLATFALVRLVIGQLTGRSLAAALSGVRPEVSLLVQIGISLLSAAPAITSLVNRGRKVGITAESLGLRSRGIFADVVWGFSGYAVALPLVYLSSVVSTWLFRGVASPPHPVIAELSANRGPLYMALMFLQVAVIPPIIEELMFRGVFFRALSARMSIPAAVVLTSTLFAVLHPQLPLGFLGIFTLGVVFNLLAIHRRSLFPGMVAHALNNGVIFAFFVLLMAD